MARASWQICPVLGVRDVRRAAEYWRDVLGFHLEPDGVFAPEPGEPGGVYAIVDRAGVRVHFQIRFGDAAATRRQRPPFERDVYLYVDDVEAVHAELTRRGARLLHPPRTMPYGLRETVAEDPDGHRVTFGEIVR